MIDRPARDFAHSGVAGCYLNCPRCGLSITQSVGGVLREHCPRCIARANVAVELFASTLPTSELYKAGSAPRADHAADSAAPLPFEPVEP